MLPGLKDVEGMEFWVGELSRLKGEGSEFWGCTVVVVDVSDGWWFCVS